MNDQRLLFDHQDGVLFFPIKQASYCKSDRNGFSCSFQCELNEELDYMSAPFFAAHNVNLDRGIRVGQQMHVAERYRQGQSLELPRVHLYAGEHYEPWSTKLEIVSFTTEAIGIIGSFTTIDPNYYDADAKDTRASFFAMFAPTSASELWSPY